MIRHAQQAAACPVGPVVVTVIVSSPRASLVALVGGAVLLRLRRLPAAIPAVRMAPIAGTADVKYGPATGPTAKQPP